MLGRHISVFAILVLFVNLSRPQDVKIPLVQTTLGKIQGNILKSQYGADIYAFRGIRYAQPPVDNLRFAAPVPVEPWEQTLEAFQDSLICPQAGDPIYMNEDCLFLNVYTKNFTNSAPVMVYIHGGANMIGSGNSLYEAGPQYLLDHDIVMVSFNYRLGALGFLSTKSPEAPGNFGYLDQVMVLEWVRDHISNFGGNPNLVTIYGMSAGSMAVTLHMASPLSKGLFHRAIAMSGSTTHQYSIDNLYWTRKLAREVSCPMYNPQDVIDCLRLVPWTTIMDVCSRWESYHFINMKWNFEIDGHFLADTPTEYFLTWNYNKVPLIMGFTKNELDFSTYHQLNNDGLLHDISVSFEDYAPELFLYNGTEYPDVATKLKKFYLSNSTTIDPSNIDDFGEIFSDGILGFGINRLLHLIYRQQPVYFYRFDYIGAHTVSGVYDANGKPKGATHADDLQYIMPGLWYGPQLAIDHPDMFMVNRLTTWWTVFARYGVPNFGDDTTEWNPSNATGIRTLFNDKEVYMGNESYVERYQLWDQLFPIMSSANRITGTLMTLSGLLVYLIRKYIL